MTTVTRLVAASLLVLALTGCRLGPRAESFTPAQAPAGVRATIQTATATVEAEVLEVREDDLLILADGELARIPWAAISRAEFHQTGIKLVGGAPPAPEARERLRLLSRFPQGVTPALSEALLAAYGQQTIKELRP